MEKFPAFLPSQASVSVLESCGLIGGEMQFKIRGFALKPVFNFGRGSLN
jgi:hypothetical protein